MRDTQLGQVAPCAARVVGEGFEGVKRTVHVGELHVRALEDEAGQPAGRGAREPGVVDLAE